MTNEDFELLAEYKEHLHTALHSDYARYVPRQVLARMVEIVRGVDRRYRLNASCPQCVLAILKDVARLYEAEIEKRMSCKRKKGNKKNEN